MRAHEDQFKVSTMSVVLKSVVVGITVGSIVKSPNAVNRIERCLSRSRKCTASADKLTGQ